MIRKVLSTTIVAISLYIVTVILYETLSSNFFQDHFESGEQILIMAFISTLLFSIFVNLNELINNEFADTLRLRRTVKENHVLEAEIEEIKYKKEIQHNPNPVDDIVTKEQSLVKLKTQNPAENTKYEDSEKKAEPKNNLRLAKYKKKQEVPQETSPPYDTIPGIIFKSIFLIFICWITIVLLSGFTKFIVSMPIDIFSGIVEFLPKIFSAKVNEYIYSILLRLQEFFTDIEGLAVLSKLPVTYFAELLLFIVIFLLLLPYFWDICYLLGWTTWLYSRVFKQHFVGVVIALSSVFFSSIWVSFDSFLDLSTIELNILDGFDDVYSIIFVIGFCYGAIQSSSKYLTKNGMAENESFSSFTGSISSELEKRLSYLED